MYTILFVVALLAVAVVIDSGYFAQTPGVAVQFGRDRRRCARVEPGGRGDRRERERQAHNRHGREGE
ncbi:hypothetical protein AB0C38_15695 [Amycolatopsis sp. NPDC048633]|uniref:hypothetical protein n=1 Tax=Amycolatopsis sp. NPDC048633 TaxID=3157095 RepID=UPI00340D8AD9